MSLLEMSLAGAVMILIICILRKIAIQKIPKKIFLILWGMVLVRLLIPVQLPTVFSVYSLMEPERVMVSTSDMIKEDALVVPEQETQINPSTLAEIEHLPEVPLGMLLWLFGAVLCGAFFLVSYLRCRREFQMSLPVEKEYLKDWLKAHPLRRSIEIRQSDRIETPLTYGILKPVILLPKNTDWENTKQLQYVLLHEYIHICHLDALLKIVMVIALCIHWFNPLVWVMYLLLNRDIELACDESVVWLSGENGKSDYSMTLIDMEAQKSGLLPFCNSFSRTAIEERITAIMKTKKLSVLTGFAGVLLIAVVLIAGAAFSSYNKNEVPEVVQEAATALITERMEGKNYIGWRINTLEYVYTYEELKGFLNPIDIYVLDYQYEVTGAVHSSSTILSDGTVLAGPQEIVNGWLTPTYPNSTYLLFSREDDELTYLFTMMENDCEPGDEVFNKDLQNKIFELVDEKVEEASEKEQDYVTSLPAESQRIYRMVDDFARAYFIGGEEILQGFLAGNYDGEIKLYEGKASHVTKVTYKGIPEVEEEPVGTKHTISVEFMDETISSDTFQYLTLEIIKQQAGGWKVEFYGREG